MSDYIRKQDLINALSRLMTGQTMSGYTWMYTTDVHDAIASLPSADVVQVVRCENCIHWSDSNQCARPELSGNRWHDAKYFDTLPDDYCSYGERREE